MRSCESRGAKSPGNARNSSSWSRSEVSLRRIDDPETRQRRSRSAYASETATCRLAGSTVPAPGS
uniref:hypothetical protein n=1 Tax=Mycobacterium tuberculosis TaxID=1773 RepID=UPI001BE11F15